METHPRRTSRQHRRGDRHGHGGESGESDDIAAEVQLDHLGLAAERATVVGEGDDEEDRPAEPGPQAGGGDARKGEGAGTELEGHDEYADPQQQGQHGRLDEPNPVGGEQLAEVVDVEHRGVPVDALDPQDHPERRHGEQAKHRSVDEQLADRLVVARRRNSEGQDWLTALGGRLSDDRAVECGIEGAHRRCGGLTSTSRRTLLVASGQDGNLT